jgi:hypothetical protein
MTTTARWRCCQAADAGRLPHRIAVQSFLSFLNDVTGVAVADDGA